MSPGSVSELEDEATVMQHFFKSYRTRRDLADCLPIVEEYWWKATEFATLTRSSVPFFSDGKPEPAASRWARAGRRAAKIGKGLCEDEKAQKLAIRYWLEAIDPRHRYGHNLHMYNEVWQSTESAQPFFYWLDKGDGKKLNLYKCPREKLQQQCIEYLGPNEREAYEVILRNGKFVYMKTGMLVDTSESDGSRWIFVLSTSRKLYIGKKQEGKFQHSSFLAGGATISAGSLVIWDGNLKAIWPYSEHYLHTKECFNEFKSFLMENNVDLTDVKLGEVSDNEDLSYATSDDGIMHNDCECSDRRDAAELGITELDKAAIDSSKSGAHDTDDEEESPYASTANRIMHNVSERTDRYDAPEQGRTELDEAASRSPKWGDHDVDNEEDLSFAVPDSLASAIFESSKPLSCRWTNGAGVRIGFMRDYLVQDFQAMALKQDCLSPQPCTAETPTGNRIAIPSPPPRPRWRCSQDPHPDSSDRAFPAPAVSLMLPPLKRRVVLSHCLIVKEREIEDNKLEVSLSSQSNSDGDCHDRMCDL